MAKTCTTCSETKPIEQFSLARNGQGQQKPVRKSKCKPCQATTARAWFAANRERSRETKFRYSMISTYGLSPEQYKKLLDGQGGACAICGQGETSAHGRTGTPYRLSVDHCHQTGRVRGLLCQKCNRSIGLFNDRVDLLRKAIDYLERK